MAKASGTIMNKFTSGNGINWSDFKLKQSQGCNHEDEISFASCEKSLHTESQRQKATFK